MTKDQIIRAWKDESFRNSLTDQQLGELPHHPAGLVELGGDELEYAAGSALTDLAEEGTYALFSLGCCSTGLGSWFISCSTCTPGPGTFDYSCK
ncbi:MAG TPA: mersacidin/lichenicidin family type 2 lantibiotic [Thermoanaerobaculia bacterium]|jgi:mersacidin/lichenicidin family type 2 lantibiotic|nr:mersacidin/lichenicidin family type 2 lantibiotic [Thermoanaerobaculia bacterium]